MAQIRYSRGRVSIEMDDTLQQLTRAAADKVLPGAVDMLERGTEWVYQSARAEWPVGKRPLTQQQPIRSRDGLRREVVFDASTNAITGRVWSIAPWAKYIKVWTNAKRGGREDRNAFVALLREPMKKLQTQLQDDILQYAIDQMRGR